MGQALRIPSAESIAGLEDERGRVKIVLRK